MKSCLCCKNRVDDSASTCPLCGEASFGPAAAAPEHDGGETPDPYDGLTKAQLLELAKERGLENVGSLNKAKLIEALQAAAAAPEHDGGANGNEGAVR